ncbi:hypothetical protein V1522DRAFT_251346 [Lipomyces starkeyi]
MYYHIANTTLHVASTNACTPQPCASVCPTSRWPSPLHRLTSLISKSSAKSIEIVRQSLKQVDVSRRSGWISLIDHILFPIAGTIYV